MNDKDVQILSIRDFPRKLIFRLGKLAARRNTSKKALIIEACEEMLRRKPVEQK